MRGNKFFSVPYDIDTNSDMMRVRQECGGIVALGRWIALLAVLYEQDGAIDFSDTFMVQVLVSRLQMQSAEKVANFISVLARVGWVDKPSWELRKQIISSSVFEQLEFKRAQAERGRSGGLAKARSESVDGENAKADC